MSILNIKFPMHLIVKLSENNYYHHKSSWKQENTLKNVLAIVSQHSRLNSLFNKPIKKSFFYDVFYDIFLLREKSFPTYLQYSIIFQSNFLFIQHNIICEKRLPYYVFVLVEINRMFL